MSSALARSTEASDTTTGTNEHSLRLVPENGVQLSTRIYSSYSGASETNVTTVSSTARSQISEHDDERAQPTEVSNQHSINQRREITVNVEYRNEEVVE
jgi:hypothetical protein